MEQTQSTSEVSVDENLQIPSHKPTQKTKIIIFAIILAVILFGVYSYFKSPKKGKSSLTERTLQKIIPSRIPSQYASMTIPYLRTKSYKSALTELSPAGQNGSYNSYLTSYESDGYKINGLLTIPTGEEPEGGWPAIVFIHGYIPPTLYETAGQSYSAYVDYLASSGYVVFKIDLRGHADSEGTPGGGYYGGDYVTDALSAYSALENADFVNPGRIGMWGHSMAGNTLMRSVAVKTDIPAIVIWGGAVYSYEDMQKYGIQDNSYRPPQTISQTQNRRRELFEKEGSPSSRSEFWKQVAPTNYLGEIKTAIQIDHAVDDEVVNIGYGRDLAALLEKTDIPHELNEYSSGGHNISGASFNQAMADTVRWFDTYLK